jgi:hypothetical protein
MPQHSKERRNATQDSISRHRVYTICLGVNGAEGDAHILSDDPLRHKSKQAQKVERDDSLRGRGSGAKESQ